MAAGITAAMAAAAAKNSGCLNRQRAHILRDMRFFNMKQSRGNTVKIQQGNKKIRRNPMQYGKRMIAFLSERVYDKGQWAARVRVVLRRCAVLSRDRTAGWPVETNSSASLQGMTAVCAAWRPDGFSQIERGRRALSCADKNVVRTDLGRAEKRAVLRQTDGFVHPVDA